MIPHHIRYLLIFGMLIACVIALIVFGALGIKDEATVGAVVGAMTLLVPALIDSHVVEKRRKNPEVSAISDDV